MLMLGDRLGEALADNLVEGDRLGEALADTLTEGELLGEADGDLDGDALAIRQPPLLSRCHHQWISTHGLLKLLLILLFHLT